MGFLADMGRSNAGPNMVKGLSDLTSDIQNRRVQMEQLNMQQAEETRKASLFAEGERTRQLRQKPIIIDDAYWNELGVDIYPETRQALVDNAVKAGFVTKDPDGNLVTNLENVDNYKKFLNVKKELAGEMAKVTYTTASKNILQTQAQIDEIKTDPTWETNKKSVETVAALQKQMKVHNQKKTVSYDAMINSNEDLMKEQLKASMKDEKPTNEMQNFATYQSSGGTLPFLEWSQQFNKAPKDEKETVEIEINGQKVKVSPAIYVAHMDRQAAREQAAIFAKANFSIRKDLAEMTMDLRKRLPASQVKTLNDSEVTLDSYSRFSDSFEDAYGGSKFLGPTMTEVYSRLGMQEGSVNWWKDFKKLDSKLRNDLFGATLTGYEKKSWDSITISENSDPKIIREQMNRRLQIATQAMERQVAGFEQAGYQTGKQVKQNKTTTKKILERRKTASGKILVKYSDGTIGEE